MEKEDKRFALLIDGENVSAKYIKGILEELSNEGVITYKRIYGDWTSANMQGWKDVLLENSVTPICGGVLPRLQRQRFYPSGLTPAGSGEDRGGHGRTEDPVPFYRGLQ